MFSDDFGFQYRPPYPDSLSVLHFFLPLRWPLGSVQLNFCPLAQTSISATGWEIRGKCSGLVHCARSKTVRSKWRSHCQVFWVGKEIDVRISTQQACSVLFDFLSPWLQNELSRQQRLSIARNGTETAITIPDPHSLVDTGRFGGLSPPKQSSNNINQWSF